MFAFYIKKHLQLMNVYTTRLKGNFQEYSVLVSREIFMGNAIALEWRTKNLYFIISS